jgi:hypothetical protein
MEWMKFNYWLMVDYYRENFNGKKRINADKGYWAING